MTNNNPGDDHLVYYSYALLSFRISRVDRILKKSSNETPG